MSGWGPLIGGMVAVGLLLCLSWLRARRPLPMLQRIAPFVGAPDAAGVPAVPAVPAVPSMVEVVTSWAIRLRASIAPAPGALTWMAVGAAAGAGAGLLLAIGGASVLLVGVLGAVGAVAGTWTCGQHRALLQRRWRMTVEAQLPAVADLLSFSVTAGESLASGIARVAATLGGPLADELRQASDRIQQGMGIEASLRSVASGVVPYERFVDAVVVAMERGTPLADVLRAQADDVRAARRRTLLELAGRRDVLMLVPVVFLILPTVVLIALFPAAQALRLLSS